MTEQPLHPRSDPPHRAVTRPRRDIDQIPIPRLINPELLNNPFIHLIGSERRQQSQTRRRSDTFIQTNHRLLHPAPPDPHRLAPPTSNALEDTLPNARIHALPPCYFSSRHKPKDPTRNMRLTRRPREFVRQRKYPMVHSGKNRAPPAGSTTEAASSCPDIRLLSALSSNSPRSKESDRECGEEIEGDDAAFDGHQEVVIISSPGASSREELRR